MKSTLCSTNWGKGLVFAMLVMILALMMITLGTLHHNAAPNGVGVDWGSRCPAEDPKCKRQGVDWGSLTAPCLPTDSNCKNGPVAVDWGNKAPCDPKDSKCILPCDPKDSKCFLPCDPKDLTCTIDPGTKVDWGS